MNSTNKNSSAHSQSRLLHYLMVQQSQYASQSTNEDDSHPISAVKTIYNNRSSINGRHFIHILALLILVCMAVCPLTEPIRPKASKPKLSLTARPPIDHKSRRTAINRNRKKLPSFEEQHANYRQHLEILDNRHQAQVEVHQRMAEILLKNGRNPQPKPKKAKQPPFRMNPLQRMPHFPTESLRQIQVDPNEYTVTRKVYPQEIGGRHLYLANEWSKIESMLDDFQASTDQTQKSQAQQNIIVRLEHLTIFLDQISQQQLTALAQIPNLPINPASLLQLLKSNEVQMSLCGQDSSSKLKAHQVVRTYKEIRIIERHLKETFQQIQQNNILPIKREQEVSHMEALVNSLTPIDIRRIEAITGVNYKSYLFFLNLKRVHPQEQTAIENIHKLVQELASIKQTPENRIEILKKYFNIYENFNQLSSQSNSLLLDHPTIDITNVLKRVHKVVYQFLSLNIMRDQTVQKHIKALWEFKKFMDTDWKQYGGLPIMKTKPWTSKKDFISIALNAVDLFAHQQFEFLQQNKLLSIQTRHKMWQNIGFLSNLKDGLIEQPHFQSFYNCRAKPLQPVQGTLVRNRLDYFAIEAFYKLQDTLSNYIKLTQQPQKKLEKSIYRSTLLKLIESIPDYIAVRWEQVTKFSLQHIKSSLNTPPNTIRLPYNQKRRIQKLKIVTRGEMALRQGTFMHQRSRMVNKVRYYAKENHQESKTQIREIFSTIIGREFSQPIMNSYSEDLQQFANSNFMQKYSKVRDKFKSIANSDIKVILQQFSIQPYDIQCCLLDDIDINIPLGQKMKEGVLRQMLQLSYREKPLTYLEYKKLKNALQEDSVTNAQQKKELDLKLYQERKAIAQTTLKNQPQYEQTQDTSLNYMSHRKIQLLQWRGEINEALMNILHRSSVDTEIIEQMNGIVQKIKPFAKSFTYEQANLLELISELFKQDIFTQSHMSIKIVVSAYLDLLISRFNQGFQNQAALTEWAQIKVQKVRLKDLTSKQGVIWTAEKEEVEMNKLINALTQQQTNTIKENYHREAQSLLLQFLSELKGSFIGDQILKNIEFKSLPDYKQLISSVCKRESVLSQTPKLTTQSLVIKVFGGLKLEINQKNLPQLVKKLDESMSLMSPKQRDQICSQLGLNWKSLLANIVFGQRSPAPPINLDTANIQIKSICQFVAANDPNTAVSSLRTAVQNCQPNEYISEQLGYKLKKIYNMVASNNLPYQIAKKFACVHIFSDQMSKFETNGFFLSDFYHSMSNSLKMESQAFLGCSFLDIIQSKDTNPGIQYQFSEESQKTQKLATVITEAVLNDQTVKPTIQTILSEYKRTLGSLTSQDQTYFPEEELQALKMQLRFLSFNGHHFLDQKSPNLNRFIQIFDENFPINDWQNPSQPLTTKIQARQWRYYVYGNKKLTEQYASKRALKEQFKQQQKQENRRKHIQEFKRAQIQKNKEQEQEQAQILKIKGAQIQEFQKWLSYKNMLKVQTPKFNQGNPIEQTNFYKAVKDIITENHSKHKRNPGGELDTLNVIKKAPLLKPSRPQQKNDGDVKVKRIMPISKKPRLHSIIKPSAFASLDDKIMMNQNLENIISQDQSHTEADQDSPVKGQTPPPSPSHTSPPPPNPPPTP